MLKLDTFLKERSTIPALYRRCEGRLQYQDTYLLCLVVRMVIIITNGILSVLLFTRLELEKNICYISTIIRTYRHIPVLVRARQKHWYLPAACE
jgi:hypothetical protein